MKTPLAAVLSLTSIFMSLSASAKGDGGDLQGRWEIVSVPDGWKKVPGTSVLISSGEVRICVGRIPASKFAYKLDPATGAVEASRKVKGKVVVQRGIYRRNGDTLTVSVGAEGKPPPPNADSTAGGAMRWVFRRSG
jgi:hypothetical protein